MLKQECRSLSEVIENSESKDIPPKEFTFLSQESFSDFSLL